ncbi:MULTISPECIES: hypothetical protein [unclassified Aeromicrobium]|uniref:phage tail tube protein n=1 Tax=unclassified Aeromicrobium TaxID=2633570 RepID=UPI0028890EDE|nr:MULTISPECIES: hypothetical protein [unclassified Aeromicrobium]
MSQDDNAVFLPGRGHLFTNEDIGAEFPFTTQSALAALDLTADVVGDGWVNLGHTSSENNIALSRETEGGETKGSYQKPALRKTNPTVVWAFNIPALQISNDVLSLYFGGGDASEPDAFYTPFVETVTERALGIVLVDGPARFGWGVPKVAIEAGDGAPEFDPENFMEFPLLATVLEESSAKGLMGLFRAGLGTPTAP